MADDGWRVDEDVKRSKLGGGLGKRLNVRRMMMVMEGIDYREGECLVFLSKEKESQS